MKKIISSLQVILLALALASAQENASFDFTGAVSGKASGSIQNKDSVFSIPGSPYQDSLAAASIDGKLSFSRNYTTLGLLDFSFTDTAVIDSADGSTNESLSFKINELYADLNFGDIVYARLGKQRLSWGTGFVLNPSDPINPPKNPTSARTTLEGIPALKAEILAEPVSLMTFAVLHENLDETGYGGKLSTSAIPNTDISVSGYWSPSQSWTGAFNASVAPLYSFPGWDSILFWCEASLYEQNRYASFSDAQPEFPQTYDAKGVTTAILGGISARIPKLDTLALAEYYRLFEGLTKNQTAIALENPAWYGELARRPGRLGRDYLFISLTQTSITSSGHPVLDKIGLSASCLANLTDRSYWYSVGMGIGIIDNSSIDLSSTWATGGSESEFGNAPEKIGFSLKMSVFF